MLKILKNDIFRMTFNTVAENGEKIKGRWLIYLISADSAFCFCCRLFDPLSKSQFGQKLGHRDWKHILQIDFDLTKLDQSTLNV